jgi:hypothetical protein
MTCRRRTLLLALAVLLLLAVGLGLAILWPMPSEAEKDAASIRVGMTPGQVHEVIETLPSTRLRLMSAGEDGVVIGISYDDESGMSIWYVGEGGSLRVREVEVFAPPPVHPLTRLRRTRARVLPFLAD